MPSRARPYATLALVASSTAMLAYQLTLTSPDRLSFLLAHGLIPASTSLWNFGSASWVQLDLVSGAINLLALWIFGDNVEDRLGRPRFLLLFFAGGAIASLAAVALDPSSRSVLPAAAGAVGAVVGAHLSLFPRARVMVLVPLLRDVDLVDVPSVIIAFSWLALHSLRHAGTWIVDPAAGALVIPVVGLAAGSLAARALKLEARMSVEWWGAPR